MRKKSENIDETKRAKRKEVKRSNLYWYLVIIIKKWSGCSLGIKEEPFAFLQY